MAKPTPIPKQLFVVGKEQVEHDYATGQRITSPIAFGFLNAYEPNKKTWSNKEATQMNWAYQRWGCQIEKRNGIYYNTGFTNGEWDPVGRCYLQLPFDEPLPFQPVIWDNVPTVGFKILKSVSRYSTANKLWRILDPRGVELEISTGCLEELMMNTTIHQGGLIDAPCVWMSNKNLIVTP